LPKQGLMQGGLCWEQTMWEPLTNASGSGFWPTPTAMSGGTSVAPSHLKSGEGRHGWNLGAAVNDSMSGEPIRMWPTPTFAHVAFGNHDEPVENYLKRVKDYEEGRAKGKPGKSLGVAVRLWPTPTVQDSNKATKRWREDYQNNLTAAVFNPERMFPTPTSRDYKGGYTTESLTRKDGKSRAMDALPNAVLDGKGVETCTGGQLSPTWVEWLMGWPLEWTDLKPLEMGKCRSWLRAHGKY